MCTFEQPTTTTTTTTTTTITTTTIMLYNDSPNARSPLNITLYVSLTDCCVPFYCR
jgi:hypothetical protein